MNLESAAALFFKIGIKMLNSVAVLCSVPLADFMPLQFQSLYYYPVCLPVNKILEPV
jgi:hypothetical protein